MKSNLDDLMNVYMSQNPKGTLLDFKKWLKEMDNIEDEQNKKIEDYYKSLVGKYFKLYRFHSVSYVVIKLIDNELYMDEYTMTGYKNDMIKTIHFYKDEEFDSSFFKNPYETPIKDDSYYYVETTEEDYERFKKLHENLSKMIDFEVSNK